MNPLIMIPARMAATRLPNKPLALIGDVPMIVRAYRHAEASGLPVVAAAGDPEREARDRQRSSGKDVEFAHHSTQQLRLRQTR